MALSSPVSCPSLRIDILHNIVIPVYSTLTNQEIRAKFNREGDLSLGTFRWMMNDSFSSSSLLLDSLASSEYELIFV